MFAIIGIVIVFGAVIGGFLMEKGHIMVLVQPAEVLILVGAAVGTLLVANPMHIIKGVVAGLLGVLKGSKFDKKHYLSTLKMMYEFLNKVRKEGLLSVEMDVEKPSESTSSRTILRSSATITHATLCATRCARRSPEAWSLSTWIR